MKDYSCIFLVDTRYGSKESHYKQLQKWTKDKIQIVNCSEIENLKQQIHDFFALNYAKDA